MVSYHHCTRANWVHLIKTQSIWLRHTIAVCSLPISLSPSSYHSPTHMEGQQTHKNEARRANSGTQRVGRAPQTDNRISNKRPIGVMIKILEARLKEALPQLFHKKVVLAFAGACASTQARSWVTAFNVNLITQLSFKESLINSLFVVKVEVKLGGETREELATKHSHKADGRFATINLYQSTFHLHNPLLFKYLVTIRIQKGSPETFALLDDIFNKYGKVVDHNILARNHLHMIIVLLSTTCREFAHDAYVELENNKIFHVELEYYEPCLCCIKCFSPNHTAELCSHIPTPCLAPTALIAQLQATQSIPTGSKQHGVKEH